MQNVKITGSQIRSLIGRFNRAKSMAKHSQNDVVTATGLYQYQVSRILNGQFKTLNKSVLKICNYADCILGPSTTSTEKIEEKLIVSVLDLWDGTVIDGEGIVGLLKRLKQYRKNIVNPPGTLGIYKGIYKGRS